MLTRKQRDLLVYVEQQLRATGVSPSFEEMKEALGLQSKSGVHRLISGLEERGFIRRHAHRARALEVVRLPDDLASLRAKEAAPASDNIVRPQFGQRSTGGEGEAAAVTLPLYGRIAAGQPIEALRDTGAVIEVPNSLVGGGEHYALVVSGDSMQDDGILDGDTVVIRRGDQAESGTIVVALVDGAEVTLKRIRLRGQTVALEPANARYETRIFGPGRVKVQGRMVGLIRRY